MLTALHGIRMTNWGMRKVFWWVSIGIFAWEWVPLAIYKPLSYFSWPCWISGLDNYNINLVFNDLMGMGLNMISLDWYTIQAALGSPLYVPWFSQICVIVGAVLGACILAPSLIGSNASFARYVPFSSSPHGPSQITQWIQLRFKPWDFHRRADPAKALTLQQNRWLQHHYRGVPVCHGRRGYLLVHCRFRRLGRRWSFRLR